MNTSSTLFLTAFAAVLATPAQAQVQNPDNGHWYQAVTSSLPIDWNQASADASAQIFMGAHGHLATICDQSENDFVASVAPSDVWIGGWQDHNNPGYSEPAGGWVWVTGESMSYTNWSPSEPNNSGGGEDHLEMNPGGAWNDEGASAVFAYMIEYEPTTGTAYCSGDGGGTLCPCANNNDGSMGGCDWGDASFRGGGALGATGSTSMAANDTLLVATRVSNDFGIFFGAANQVNGGNGNWLNDGLRCAGGGLIRLISPTMATGNQMTLPNPIQILDTAAAAGVTRRYQYWFRTPGGPCGQMANLTNGYEITWLP